MRTNLSRRGVLAALAGAGLASAGPARAEDAPLLKESDPGARSVDYVEDAARVDRRKFPAHVPGQLCRNCALYGGDAGQAQGGCQLFIGVEVRAGGWCASWEARPAS
jgi:hypothetical protein